MEATQLWVASYQQKRRKWESDRKKFKQLNGRSVTYVDHLKENMPMTCPNSWVLDQVKEKYGAYYHYAC